MALHGLRVLETASVITGPFTGLPDDPFVDRMPSLATVEPPVASQPR